MRILKQITVFDTADLDAESAFWAGLLGGEVAAEPDWHTVMVDGQPRIAFQLAPNHTPPNWPGGQPQQLHLDIYVDEPREAIAQAESLGARLLKAASDLDGEEGFQVYADPSGHPFCICWG